MSFGMQGDFTIAFAKTNPEINTKGITALLMPLELPGTRKFQITNIGLLPLGPASFVLSKVCIPIKYRIGGESEGFHIYASTVLFSDFSRYLRTYFFGYSSHCIRLAISYAKKRIAFGHRVTRFEGLLGKIAEDATLIDAGRWLCYRALWLKD